MEIYLFPITTAMITFLAITTMITIPYMSFSYRKYGSVSLFRTLIIFSFVLYILTAYYLVILPLPNPETLEPMNNIMDHVQLIPFQFIADFINHTVFRITDFNTYLPALRQSVFIQVFFNIMLTVPFGIYLAYYLKKDLKKTVLFTFLLSLFFEITQLTALYGLYPRPYRLFDVDDLILNTLGGLIGYVIYKKFLGFLPSRDEIDKKNLVQSQKVGYIRRIFALSVDFTIVSFVVGILLSESLNWLWNLAILNLILLVYFMISQLIFKRTIGQRIVNIRLTLENKEQSYYLSVFIRYTIIVTVIFLLSLLNTLIENVDANGIYAVLYAIIWLGILTDFLLSFKRDKKLLSDILSNTINKNTKEIVKIK